jgi:hypothetical protein
MSSLSARINGVLSKNSSVLSRTIFVFLFVCVHSLLFLAIYYYGDKSEKDGTGRAYSTYGVEVRSIWSFGGEA